MAAYCTKKEWAIRHDTWAAYAQHEVDLITVELETEIALMESKDYNDELIREI